MIFSTIFKGSLVAGELCVVEVCEEMPSERTFRIPARVRYRACLKSS